MVRRKGNKTGLNSLKPPRCSRCLRSGHSALDCRHLSTCRRCKGSDHIAAYSPIKSPLLLKASKNARLSRQESSPPSNTVTLGSGNDKAPQNSPFHLQRSVLSLPLIPEIIKAKQDLKRVFIVSVKAGYVNTLELQKILPEALKLVGSGSVQWFCDDSYLFTV